LTSPSHVAAFCADDILVPISRVARLLLRALGLFERPACRRGGAGCPPRLGSILVGSSFCFIF